MGKTRKGGVKKNAAGDRKVKRIAVKVLAILIILGLVCLLIASIPSSKVKKQSVGYLRYIVDRQCVEGMDRNYPPETSKDLQFGDVAVEAFQNYGADCIVILGCGLKTPDTPSDMLRDRLFVGTALYHAGAADKIVLTGDSSSAASYDEVGVMKAYCLASGVPEEAIVEDPAGLSTYASLENVKDMGMSKIVLVTQKYHIYRAIYTAQYFGLEVAGVSADPERYIKQPYYSLREIAARDKYYFMLREE